jgi:hypothetical protein
MGAPDLLQHLRGAGFKLDVAGNKLMVAPAGALTDDYRQAIRDHKAALLALLAGEADDAEHEAFEERAAIMQFDGGLSRADAETEARACTACEFQSRRRTCLEPVLAGLAPHFSIWFTDMLPDGGARCTAFKETHP